MSVATLLIALCIGFIVLLVKAANQQSFLVVFVVAFIIAILIIFFTAKDSLK
jgi:Na+/melibiose symporter-like transporter